MAGVRSLRALSTHVDYTNPRRQLAPPLPEQPNAPFPSWSIAAVSLLRSLRSCGLLCSARGQCLLGLLVGLPATIAVDGARTVDVVCTFEGIFLLLTVESCIDESATVFRAHRKCSPNGVQGNGFHLSEYVNWFDDGLREIIF